MLKHDVLIEYILQCLHELTPESRRPIGPQSNLVEDLGLESIKILDLLMMLEDHFDLSIPINILIDVTTPVELANALVTYLENHHGAV
ncbi:acyl carrier protein [Pseudomonas sp. RIT-To-2]|uniref:acyl carrier protein n=1 Tax=Pseudomonas sp. RIT-To-2 TaxID=3462541 RepID=UPI0024132980